jgi:hypothetical protein
MRGKVIPVPADQPVPSELEHFFFSFVPCLTRIMVRPVAFWVLASEV